MRKREPLVVSIVVVAGWLVLRLFFETWDALKHVYLGVLADWRERRGR